MFEHFRCDWTYAEPNLFGELSKFVFFKMFTLVLLDGFLEGFSKVRLIIVEICILLWYFWVIFENYSMRSAQCACWALKGTISSSESTLNEFSMLTVEPAVKYRQFLHVHPNACWDTAVSFKGILAIPFGILRLPLWRLLRIKFLQLIQGTQYTPWQQHRNMYFVFWFLAVLHPVAIWHIG